MTKFGGFVLCSEETTQHSPTGSVRVVYKMKGNFVHLSALVENKIGNCFMERFAPLLPW